MAKERMRWSRGCRCCLFPLSIGAWTARYALFSKRQRARCFNLKTAREEREHFSIFMRGRGRGVRPDFPDHAASPCPLQLNYETPRFSSIHRGREIVRTPTFAVGDLV